VWSFCPEMNRSGPRSGFLLSTFASVHGVRLAAAAWKIGAPDAGADVSSLPEFGSAGRGGVVSSA